jgi:hypothetical protein
MHPFPALSSILARDDTLGDLNGLEVMARTIMRPFAPAISSVIGATGLYERLRRLELVVQQLRRGAGG